MGFRANQARRGPDRRRRLHQRRAILSGEVQADSAALAARSGCDVASEIDIKFDIGLDGDTFATCNNVNWNTWEASTTPGDAGRSGRDAAAVTAVGCASGPASSARRRASTAQSLAEASCAAEMQDALHAEAFCSGMWIEVGVRCSGLLHIVCLSDV